MIYIFTGNGKGKTSAALGILLRGLAIGWHVGWVSWYKNQEWRIAEHRLSEILTEEAQSRLHFYAMGKGFYISEPDSENGKEKGVKIRPVHQQAVIDAHTSQEHESGAQKALEMARTLLPTVDLLVLDEVCNAVSDGLVQEDAVLEVIKNRAKTHIVLTGRNCPPGLLNMSDLVSEIDKKKHPYDAGVMAVPGLDF